MSRAVKGAAACAALVAGHCGLTLLAASLNAAWIAAVPLFAICRGVVGA